MTPVQPDRPRLPTTRTLWSWQVDDVQAPGWQETVLVGGVTNGQHTILRLARGGRWPSPDLVASEIDEHGQPGWRGESLDASGRLDGFGARLGKTLGHWAQTGQLHGSTPTACAALTKAGVRALTEVELDRIAGSFENGFITGISAYQAMIEQGNAKWGGTPLLEAMAQRRGPTDESTGAAIWLARMAQGRRWSWGSALTTDDQQIHEEMERRDLAWAPLTTDPFDPRSDIRPNLARQWREAVAMGQTPQDAAHTLLSHPTTRKLRA